MSAIPGLRCHFFQQIIEAASAGLSCLAACCRSPDRAPWESDAIATDNCRSPSTVLKGVNSAISSHSRCGPSIWLPGISQGLKPRPFDILAQVSDHQLAAERVLRRKAGGINPPRSARETCLGFRDRTDKIPANGRSDDRCSGCRPSDVASSGLVRNSYCHSSSNRESSWVRRLSISAASPAASVFCAANDVGENVIATSRAKVKPRATPIFIRISCAAPADSMVFFSTEGCGRNWLFYTVRTEGI